VRYDSIGDTTHATRMILIIATRIEVFFYYRGSYHYLGRNIGLLGG